MDELKNLTVYDLVSKQQIFTEMNVSAVSFNCDCEDLLAYSSANMIFIKLNNLPSNMLKTEGTLLGFKASKLFISGNSLTTLDIP